MASARMGVVNLYKDIQPPKEFNFIRSHDPGYYLLGHSNFVARPVHLVSIFHRQLGPFEEFLLAILSVFLIAILSELSYTLLLRRRNSSVPISHIRAACLLNETAHLRALPSLIRNRNTSNSSRHRAIAAISIRSIALLLFALDVVCVALTQPSEAPSSIHAYNLRAFHPVGTTKGMSQYIRRQSGDRFCVSPIVANATLAHRYLISACHRYETTEGLSEENDTTTGFTITTLFHEGGADHTLSTIDGQASISVSIRAQVFVNTNNGKARRLLFTSEEDATHTHARYIHLRTIADIINYSCQKNYSLHTCSEHNKTLTMESSEPITNEVKLWRGRNNFEYKNVTGLQSNFSTLPHNNPFKAINDAVRYVAVSTAIQEVLGPANYKSLVDDSFEDGIEGLVTEQSRIAGVLPLSIIVIVMFLLLIGLRLVLRPVSLAEVAFDHVSHGVTFPERGPDISALPMGTTEDFEREVDNIQLAKKQMYTAYFSPYESGGGDDGYHLPRRDNG